MKSTSDQVSHENEMPSSHAHASHLRLFIVVFLGLLGLTLVSFAIANSPLMQTPVVAWIAMIAVSCAKAFLVIAFFMHLRWEANWKFVLTIPASVMSILIVLILIPDIMYREVDYNHVRRTYAADPYTASYATPQQTRPSTANESVEPATDSPEK